MPTFNRLAYLPEAVRSIFAQTVNDWELIVVDDGSDEPVLSYLAALESDPRVRIIRSAHTGTPSAPRNVGISAARAPLIAFMDSDDLWEPAKLERQLAAMRAEPECGWSYMAFVVIEGNDAVRASERSRPWTPHRGYIFAQTLRATASICTPSVSVRTPLVRAVGGFDEAIDCIVDYDLWMRLALESPVCVIDEPLVRVRRHADNLRRPVDAPYLARDYSLRKLAGRVSAAHARLVERERSFNALALAAAVYRSGARWRSLAPLARSAPFSWRYPRWWYGCLRALARACVGIRRAAL